MKSRLNDPGGPVRDFWSWTQASSSPDERALRSIGVILGAAAAAYACAFLLLHATPETVLGDTLANVLPLAVLGPATWAATRGMAAASGIVRTIAHPFLAVAFGLAWYLAVIVLISIRRSALDHAFTVEPFYLVAVVWQIVQGVALYALFAVLASWPEAVVPEPENGPDRLLVRDGDDILLLDFNEIIRVQGRDDYSEIFTARGPRLARLSLADLDRALPAERFLRVHRSHIVNLDEMRRAESAGAGRITLHMADGIAVTTSRAGAQKVRSRLV